MNLFKNNHANQRYFERVLPDAASKRDIIKALQHVDNIQYIKRMTESRSMAYIHLPKDNIVKVILNKKKKELVTILPWVDIYRTELTIHNDTLGSFCVVLYPDCYLETTNSSTFNKIIKIDGDGKDENISFSSNIFEEVFLQAWQQYSGQSICRKLN